MGKKGKLFVVSAPSGSGKSTLCAKLLRSLSGKTKRKLVRSVSLTTRKMRRGERQGENYFFVSTDEFNQSRKRGQLLEWARILGNFYGTPREFVQKQINSGHDVLLVIDVQGAMQIKRQFPDAVFIFILPPSVRELERRLGKRSTESRKEIIRRLKLARREMEFVKEYNYVVLNDKINQALARLKEIVNLERKKYNVLRTNPRFISQDQ